MSSDLTLKGVKQIQIGMNHDNLNEHNLALKYYAIGIQYLINGLKNEKNNDIKTALKSKINKYLSRAQTLKEIVLSNSNNNTNNTSDKNPNINSNNNNSNNNDNRNNISNANTSDTRNNNKASNKSNNNTSKKKIDKQPDNNNNYSNKSKTNDDSKDLIDEQKEFEDKEITKLQKTLSSAIVIEKPNVKWDDVAGLDTAKELLKEAVILPLKFPQIFVGKRYICMIYYNNIL